MTRLLGNLATFILDVLFYGPRKGDSLIPREEDLEPVREWFTSEFRPPNDLLNFAAPCKCQDCVCGFNKPDPNRRPGQ